VEVELRYMGEKSKSKEKLSNKIVFLMIKAKNLIEEKDGEFDREKNTIMLMYRGKKMLMDASIGNYLKRDDIV